MPKPKVTYRLCPLQYTSGHLFIPLDNSTPDFSELVTEQTGYGTKDEYQQLTERESTDVEIEDKLTPPKKRKKLKSQVREAIKVTGKKIAVHEMCVDLVHVKHEAGHGTSNHAVG